MSGSTFKLKMAVAALIGVIVAAVLWLMPADLLTLETLAAQRDALTQWRETQPLAPFMFAAVYALVAALGIPAATLMTLAAGALFGFWLGLVVASFGATVGALGALLVSRFLLRDWVRRRFPDASRRIDAGIRNEGVFYLFALRLVPLFPYFLINLLFGLTSIRAWTFTWVSWIGMLAAAAVYVNAGTQLVEISSLDDILSADLLFAFVLLGLLPLLSKRLLARIRSYRVYRGWDRPERFDTNLVVVGAGAAGLVTAYVGAAAGAEVVLVERDRMGGDCLNTGCVPSKALLRAAHIAGDLRAAERLGVIAGGITVDYTAVRAHVDAAIAAIEPKDSVERYESLGVDVRRGTARLVSPWCVEIDGKAITTRAIVIATGAVPAVPPIPGLDEVSYLTTETIWDLQELPARLLILGGGAVGCELGQAFAQMGSQVCLVEQAGHLLPGEDEDIAALVADSVRGAGVDVVTGCGLAQVTQNVAKLADGRELEFTHLLVAAGRRPNLEGLGIETLGLEVDATGALKVDAYLRTRYPNILGCGDVIAGPRLTHAAAHEAWHAAVNALLGGAGGMRPGHGATPAVVYTSPECARVGLTEREAARQGIDHEVDRFDLRELDRAVADGATAGIVKVLSRPRDGRVLGAAIVAPRAGEMIGDYVLAIREGWSQGRLLRTIRPYPSYAEAARHLAGNWRQRRLSPMMLQLMQRIHAWRRS